MAHLIDKDIIVAKIKELIRANELYLSEHATDAVRLQKTSAYSVLNDLLHSVNIIEVKDVALDKEIDSYFKGFGKFASVGIDDCIDIAKHFFKLGVNASNPLTWRDMGEIDKIASLLENEWLNSTPWDGIRDWGFYQEVLKRFKAQKREKI